ncbi:MAG: TorF family putative porin [Pseudomonadota bacterium]
MRKAFLAASLATAALAVPTLAAAQAAAAAPASPHTVTGNVGLYSSYRFRGIDQTFGKPALQGGIDYSHSSGFYAGNWNSNVNQGAGYPGGNLEMDFYGGWKKTWGDWGLDVGAISYYYPGTNAGASIPFSPVNNRTGAVLSGKVDNTEVYIGGSWKFISLKYSHALSDYFGAPDTKNSHYLDLSANYDLGGGWGINGHVGQLKFKNMDNANYTDWKIGVTKDLSGWVLGASYITTNAKGDCNQGQFYCFSNGSINSANASGVDKTRDAGKGTVVLSVSKTF